MAVNLPGIRSGDGSDGCFEGDEAGIASVPLGPDRSNDDDDEDALPAEQRRPLPKDVNPMNVELEGTPLSVLFERAAKLKSAHSAPLRSTFDSYPPFYQNTIFPDPDVTEARAAHRSFEERMAAARKFKEKGNELFRAGDYGGAVRRYEMAAGVFRYLENSNPNWKTEGIKDDYITEYFYLGTGDDPAQGNAITSLLVSCYTNIALASLRSAAYRIAVQACDEALNVSDETCTKAKAKVLYVRARARLEPKSAGAAEHEIALCDLERARKIDPDNGTVSKVLRTLRRSIKAQSRKDRATFRGLFRRGEIYEENSKNGTTASAETEKTYTIGETLALADLCAQRGLTEEERGLRELVENRKKAVAGGELLDFRNPTEGMTEEAKRMGVDLTDPGVVDMLEKLQMKKMAGGTMNAAGRGCRTTAEARGGILAQGAAVHQSMARNVANVCRAALSRWKNWTISRTNKGTASHPYVTALALVLAIRVGALVVSSHY